MLQNALPSTTANEMTAAGADTVDSKSCLPV